MHRLVRTSGDSVVIELYRLRMVGVSARIIRIGDDGWQVGPTYVWNNDDEREPGLAGALVEVLGIPEAEAMTLAKDSLLSWSRRDDLDAEQRLPSKVIAMLFSTFGLALLGFVVLLVLLAWAAFSLL